MDKYIGNFFSKSENRNDLEAMEIDSSNDHKSIFNLDYNDLENKSYSIEEILKLGPLQPENYTFPTDD
jgi:hypothetical protein